MAQRDFDLREIGLEQARELMEGLDQNSIVGRQYPVVCHATVELLADGVVRHVAASPVR